jgi:hypothetical protein
MALSSGSLTFSKEGEFSTRLARDAHRGGPLASVGSSGSWLGRLWRWLAAVGLCAVPFVVLLSAFFGWSWSSSLVGLGVGLGVFVAALLRSERQLCAVLGVAPGAVPDPADKNQSKAARQGPLAGVETSWRRAFEDLGNEPPAVPRFFFASDPCPWVCVFRGWGTRPALVLSRGCLELLEEKELRAVLGDAGAWVGDSGLLLRSFLCSVASRVWSVAPHFWTECLVSSLVSARVPSRKAASPNGPLGGSLESERLHWAGVAAFAVAYAVAAAFLRLSPRPAKATSNGRLGSTNRLLAADSAAAALESARAKILRARRLWGVRFSPGTARLHLFAPTDERHRQDGGTAAREDARKDSFPFAF